MTETIDERERNKRVLERFFGTEVTDPENHLALWADNGRRELPYALPGQRPSWNGKEQITTNTLRNGGLFKNVAHTDVRIYETLDPEVFFATSNLADGCTLNGVPYHQHYIHMFHIKGGEVHLQREYMNPVLLLETLGGSLVFPDNAPFPVGTPQPSTGKSVNDES